LSELLASGEPAWETNLVCNRKEMRTKNDLKLKIFVRVFNAEEEGIRIHQNLGTFPPVYMGFTSQKTITSHSLK
jgi:hypothetical protein